MRTKLYLSKSISNFHSESNIFYDDSLLLVAVKILRFTQNDKMKEKHKCHSESGISLMKNLVIKRYKTLLPINRDQNGSSLYVFFLKRLLFLTILFTFTLTACTDAQIFTDKDVKICNSTFQLSVKNNLSSKPINEVIVEVGKSFIGTDYVSHTLEVDGEENLVINLTAFDCFTFLENSLVLSRCIKQHKTTFEDYMNELTRIRYRYGKIDHYPSRLHYFADWIYDNQKKRILKDVTKQLGGERLELNLSFMSDHPEYYKQLKENPDFIKEIRKQEEETNKREYYFIPKEKISEIENKIKNGDLLAFTSTIEGLDVNHVGIAVRMDNGRIHILHAPIEGSPVQITKLPLAEYVMKIEKDTGIIVVKALDPYE